MRGWVAWASLTQLRRSAMRFCLLRFWDTNIEDGYTPGSRTTSTL